MRKCPFCGQAVKPAFPQMMYVKELQRWSFHHACNDDISVIIFGQTEEEVIGKWEGVDGEEHSSDQ